MREEWIEELLKDAQKILKEPVISINSDALENIRLEKICSYFLKAFKKTAEIRFFEGFYQVSATLFTWFARKCSINAGFGKDTVDVTTLFYSVLCEASLKPGVNVPSENLFGWCFCTIENIVTDKIITSPETSRNISKYEIDRFLPSSSEAWTRKTMLSESERIEECIIDIIFSGDADLTLLESKVLRLYYGERLSLDALATTLGMSKENAVALFHTCRKKVLLELYNRESDYLKAPDEKEERQ